MSDSLSNYERQQIVLAAYRLEAGSHVFTTPADESEWGWIDPRGWFEFVELASAWNDGLGVASVGPSGLPRDKTWSEAVAAAKLRFPKSEPDKAAETAELVKADFFEGLI